MGVQVQKAGKYNDYDKKESLIQQMGYIPILSIKKKASV